MNTKRFHQWIVVAIGMGSMTASLAAQSEIHEFVGQAGDEFGWSVAGAGDVDNDGRDDVIVGMPLESEAIVYSGRTGAILHRFLGNRGDNFGHAVEGVGDLDLDGHDDVIVGAPEATWSAFSRAGRIVVYSGATGAKLHEHGGSKPDRQLGFSVAGVGDLNGNRRGDFAAGATESGSGAGRVTVWDGLDGREIDTWLGEASGDLFGGSLGAAGDVDGDGSPDVIIGARGADFNGSASGAVYVMSGSTGQQTHRFVGAGAGAQFGWDVDGIGDVDKDGFDDIAASAIFEIVNGKLSGAVHLISGAKGGLIRRLGGDADAEWYGASVAGIGDINGDGLPDIAIGIPKELTSAGITGSVEIHSGNGASRLYKKSPGFKKDYGWSVDAAGDVDGDGLPDLIVGAPKDNTDDAGAAWVLGGAELRLDGDPSYVYLTTTLTLELQGTPNKPYALFVTSVNGVPLALLVSNGLLGTDGRRVLNLPILVDIWAEVKFQAFSPNNGGKILRSNPEKINFMQIN